MFPGNVMLDCLAVETYKGVFTIGWVSTPSLSLLSFLTKDARRTDEMPSTNPPNQIGVDYLSRFPFVWLIFFSLPLLFSFG